MNTLDIPTNQTLEFVQAHLSAAPARILEIGCGNGELAHRLQVLGHQIIGIDSSPEAVREARQLGVEARIAQWPEFEEKMFSALKNYFAPLLETSAPYLYRYLCPLLEDDKQGDAIASQVFDLEKRLAQTGAIKLIGRRFVGRR